MNTEILDYPNNGTEKRNNSNLAAGDCYLRLTDKDRPFESMSNDDLDSIYFIAFGRWAYHLTRQAYIDALNKKRNELTETPRETLARLDKELKEEKERRANLNREDVFIELYNLFVFFDEAKDYRAETEIKEKIFQFLIDTKGVELTYDLPMNYNPHS